MRYYIEINGISSLTLTGFAIKELPPISKPPIRNQIEQIDGRDGDLITKLGYGAYDKTIEVGLYGDDYDINDIISFFNSEGIITFSNEPDKYYNFTMLNQIDFEKLLKFKTATITFHCQPFKYKKNEEPIEVEYQYVEGEGTDITLNNTDDQPLNMELYGNTAQNGIPDLTNPSELHKVSGNNNINTIGENLYYMDYDDVIANNWNGLTIKSSKTGYSINGTSTGTTAYTLTNRFVTLAAGTYKLLLKNISQLNIYLSKTNYAQIIRVPKGSQSAEFTLNEETKVCLTLSIVTGDVYNEENEIMITSRLLLTNFVPYSKDIYFINLPIINLLDSQYFERGAVGITGNETTTVTNAKCSNYISVKPNTPYTISANTSLFDLRLAEYDAEKTFVTRKNKTNATFLTITTGNSTYFLRWTFNYDNSTATTQEIIDSLQLQLEEGTKVNQYTPFGTTSIEMNSNRDGFLRDSFLYNVSDNKWYKKLKIKNIVFDGSEDWALFNSNANRTAFKIDVNNIETYTDGDVIPDLMSNRFTPISYNGTWVEGKLSRLTQSSVQNALILIMGPNMTVSDLQTWLSNNNTEVNYNVKEDELEEVTYQPLITQLNLFLGAVAKKGQTNINQINNDLPFYITAITRELGSDTAVINNEGNIESKPILNIEGEGTIGVSLNGNQIFNVDLSDPNQITIDPNILEAYNPSSLNLMNRKVIGDIANLKLPEGTNELKFSGTLTKATIKNYSRWL